MALLSLQYEELGKKKSDILACVELPQPNPSTTKVSLEPHQRFLTLEDVRVMGGVVGQPIGAPMDPAVAEGNTALLEASRGKLASERRKRALVSLCLFVCVIGVVGAVVAYVVASGGRV